MGNENWQAAIEAAIQQSPIYPKVTYGSGPSGDFSGGGSLCPTDMRWQGKLLLAAHKAAQPHCACIGTVLWAIAQALKELGLESKIALSDMRRFCKLALTDEGDRWKTGTPYYETPQSAGVAYAMVDLGWADRVSTDASEVVFGDVGIRWHRDGKQLISGHTVIATGLLPADADVKEQYPDFKAQPAIDTWSATRTARNVDSESGEWVTTPGPGYDFYYIHRSRTSDEWPGQTFQRCWLFAHPTIGG